VETVYLSKRNVLSLLSKLDRAKAGEFSACTIIKNDNTHKKYPQSMESIAVTAHEEGEQPILYYYADMRLLLSRNKLNELLNLVNNESALGSIKLKGFKVFAIADELYYTEREAGAVHPADESRK
jgi:hypothetical protein